MVHLPLVISENNNEGAIPAPATATPGLPPRPPPPPPNGCVTFWCRRRWTAERIAHCGSNGVILLGCLTALAFAIYAVKDVTQEYTMLTMFIVGGTVFGGGCLMALINVSWLSRKPGVRVSAIQIICNVVLVLICSYLELLFWPFPVIAYSILFGAGIPMFFLINLPACFPKKYPDHAVEGDTVCLDQDALDDATIVEEPPTKGIDNSSNNNNNEEADTDITQQTMALEEERDMFDVVVDIEAPPVPAIPGVSPGGGGEETDFTVEQQQPREAS